MTGTAGSADKVIADSLCGIEASAVCAPVEDILKTKSFVILREQCFLVL